jgi:branched-chain amino acid transport system permease protein
MTPRQVLQWVRGEPGRRLGSCVFLMVVLALMTGSEGTGDHPFTGVRHSLLAARIVGFLVAAVAMFALWTAVSAGRLTPSLSRVRGFGSAGGALLERRQGRYGFYLLLLVAAILLPRALPGYLQQAAFSAVGIYALLGLGLNVVVGYAGLLDLGYIAFYAIGAYTTAYFSFTDAQEKAGSTPIPWHAPFHLNGFLVLPVAVIVAALAGVILGGPTLRLRGDYLAIVTLGFGEIVQILANNADGVTNGPRGAFGVPHLSVDLGFAHYRWGIDALPNYYLLLGLVVPVMIAFSQLERSRIGRAWAAIREDEVAAAAVGIPTTRYKLLAFAIGASTSGFAGVIYASYQFFNPETFSLEASILVLTIVIFGGMGSIFGVIVGGTVLQGLTAYLQHSNTIPAQDTYIFFGAIVILMMVFRPQGLVPSRRRSREIKLSEEGIGSADALGAAEGVGG